MGWRDGSTDHGSSSNIPTGPDISTVRPARTPVSRRAQSANQPRIRLRPRPPPVWPLPLGPVPLHLNARVRANAVRVHKMYPSSAQPTAQ
eukprot:3441859-Prymnesium_polylepis.3